MALPTTKTDLINLALDYVGEPPIADPTSTQTVPSLCDRHYDLARMSVLQDSKWAIALALDDLAEVSLPAPPPPWTRSFQLPTDWLATFDSSLGGYKGPRTVAYRTMGQRIYTMASAVRILYVRDIENVSEMPAYLARAIAYQLATELVIPIKGDDKLMRLLEVKRDQVLQDAMQAGAIVDPIEVWGVDYLTTARKGYNSPLYASQIE
jgi:hypothetical protein